MITPYHYTYLNVFAGKFSESNNKFENDYWGVSLKELSENISKNDSLISKKLVKFSICGVSNKITKYNLNKFASKINYKIVRDEESPDYIILTNRIVQVNDGDGKNYKTCFNKYRGKNILEVKRNNLVLSAVKRYK